MSRPLDRADLEAEAIRRVGLDDFGDVPYVEPLEVLVEALEREGRVDGDRRVAAAETIVAKLVKRLQLVADRSLHPEIADQGIVAPMFIVGLPRTGSTHLHGLLGEVPGVRAPRMWEMSMPSPPPEEATATTDPRIDQIRAALAAAPTELQQRHPMDALRPEQCNMLSEWSFLDQPLLASYDIPSYREHLFDADFAPAYEAHRRTLQHLQWRRRARVRPLPELPEELQSNDS